MATAQCQDIIRCFVCDDPVEFHCNLCNTDLCSKCVLVHMKDKTKKHQVVEYSDKNCSLIFPDCVSHENKCETYCCDCEVPTCMKCVTEEHKGHEFLDLENVIKDQKEEIALDIEEQKTIFERYQTFKEAIVPQDNEFDITISKISEREEEVVRTVCKAAEKMRSDVKKKKSEVNALYTENISKVSDAEKKLQEIRRKSEQTLQSRFAIDLINYTSVNEKIQQDPCLAENVFPAFSSAQTEEDQISEILGSLSFDESNLIRELKLSSKIPAMLTIQSPYMPLFGTKCAHNGILWASGLDNTITKMDKSENILLKIENVDTPARFTINALGDLLFVALKPSGTINMFRDGKFSRYLSLKYWIAVGLCFAGYDNVLFSMRSAHQKQSRVTKFSKQTEVQRIQYDSQGLPLFSTDNNMLLPLTVNGNGDVCVVDVAKNVVVVVDDSGIFRFRYNGNIANQSKYKEFSPLYIAADVNHMILVSDSANNIVHVIDCDGNFVRYIEHTCSGGLSIDCDHNLVVGDAESGLIRFIRY